MMSLAFQLCYHVASAFIVLLFHLVLLVVARCPREVELCLEWLVDWAHLHPHHLSRLSTALDIVFQSSPCLSHPAF